MQVRQLRFDDEGFRIVSGNARSQAGVMVIGVGGSVGGPENRHPGADQWLYVISGRGLAIVEGEEHELGVGSLILIERDEWHEIRNAGNAPLETLNFYVPPAYPMG